LDSLEWSRKFPVLWISRTYLYSALGFSAEQVDSLTDEEMARLADLVEQMYSFVEFSDRVRFLTGTVLEEKGA
jgi:hypothetical protein